MSDTVLLVDSTSAISLLPSLLTGGFGLLIVALQWSLSRNVKHQDEALEQLGKHQDAAIEKLSKNIDSMRSEMAALNNNLQATAARFDTRIAVLERDAGSTKTGLEKTDHRVDKLADHWRDQFKDIETRLTTKIERTVADVLELAADARRARP